METGRTNALVRAVNWGKLGYVLISHVVDLGRLKKRGENTLLRGLTLIIRSVTNKSVQTQ